MLSNATKKKLDPQWTGPWVVQKYHGPTTLRIKKDNKEQVVHINRVRLFLEEDTDSFPSSNWSPPLFQSVSHDEHPQKMTSYLDPEVATISDQWTILLWKLLHAHTYK